MCQQVPLQQYHVSGIYVNMYPLSGTMCQNVPYLWHHKSAGTLSAVLCINRYLLSSAMCQQVHSQRCHVSAGTLSAVSCVNRYQLGSTMCHQVPSHYGILSHTHTTLPLLGRRSPGQTLCGILCPRRHIVETLERNVTDAMGGIYVHENIEIM